MMKEDDKDDVKFSGDQSERFNTLISWPEDENLKRSRQISSKKIQDSLVMIPGK